jgi:hypothetical protein
MFLTKAANCIILVFPDYKSRLPLFLSLVFQNQLLLAKQPVSIVEITGNNPGG